MKKKYDYALVSGGFDPVHVGHLRMFQDAKNLSNEVILLLNNDVEFLRPNWGYILGANAMRKEIGCVGVKLLYKNLTVQHAGIILGIGGIAGHSHKDFKSEESGYLGRLAYSQQITAVTGACLAISKKKWNILNGLDEKNLKVNYNDVDLCLRAYEKNYKNLYLSNIEAIHYESKTRGKPTGKSYYQWKREFKYMKSRWNDIIKNDPNYSQFLTLSKENWDLSLRDIGI